VNRILAGDPRNAEPLDQNFQEIVQILGALTDANIATNAGIQGTKLAANTLPGDRLISNTITQTQMGAGSVGTLQFLDLNVTRAKMSTTVGLRIAGAQTELARQQKAFSLAGAGILVNVAVTLSLEVSGGNYYANVNWIRRDASSGAITAGAITAVPTTPIPQASNVMLGLFLDSVSGINGANGAALAGNVSFVSIPAS
jgi:hypothetical protein